MNALSEQFNSYKMALYLFYATLIRQRTRRARCKYNVLAAP